MNKLHTFGCSYTALYTDHGATGYKRYKEHRGGSFPKTWSELLSERMNLTLNNHGIKAAGNDLIFETFCDKCDGLTKNDTVIIEWSYHTRVNFKFDISNETIDEITVKRDQPYYIDQVYTYEKIIDLLCKHIGVNVYYWSADRDIIYKLDRKTLNNKKYLLSDKMIPDKHNDYTPFNNVFNLGGQTIEAETNGLIVDNHFGESAHKIMADLFYDHIMNFKKIII